MRTQHIGFSIHCSNLTGSGVSHINALILIERDPVSLLYDFNLNWRDVDAGAMDHPLVTRLVFMYILRSLTFAVELLLHKLELFFSFQEQSLVLREDV